MTAPYNYGLIKPTVSASSPPVAETPPSINLPGTSISAAPAEGTSNFHISGQFDGHYEWDYGIRLMPVAGPPGTPPELIRIHSGFSWRKVQWTAARVGAVPICPLPRPNANEVLARAIIKPLTPTVTQNGVRIYRTSGWYLYLMGAMPVIGTDRLSAGSAPWDGNSSSQNDVQTALFNATDLDATGAVPANIPNIKDILGS